MEKFYQQLIIDYLIQLKIFIKHINHVVNEMKIYRLFMNLYIGMTKHFIQYYLNMLKQCK